MSFTVKFKILFLLIYLFLSSGCNTLAKKFNQEPILKIGLIADPQYENRETSGSRFYRESLRKLTEAIDTFNNNHVAFIQTLGDVINGRWESFDSILQLYDRLDISIENHYLLGNHEFAVESKYLSQLITRLQMPDYYYSYTMEGWRFIALDGTDYCVMSLPVHPDHQMKLDEYRKKANHTNNYDWNGAIGPEQQTWLKTQLDSSKLNHEKVIIFCNIPVILGNDESAILLNDYEIISLLEKYSCVVAYIAGHNHKGDHVVKNNIHYITLKSMVEGTQNSFTMLEIFKNRIQLEGFGNQPDINFDIL